MLEAGGLPPLASASSPTPMLDAPERNAVLNEAPGTVPRVKAGVMPLFSTWIYLCTEGPSHLNGRLEQLARRLMHDDRNAVQRTNRGGWHYAFDVFALDEPVVAEFRDHMHQHVQGFLNQLRPPRQRKPDRFRLQGWINVNRVGDCNVLHCH